MSLVSINDVLKITTKVEKIHPYKVIGDRDSYSPYNEGWSDCVSLIESYLEQIPSAEPEWRWIPVTEALPEEDEEVLVTVRFDGTKDVPPSVYVETASQISGTWLSYSDEWKVMRQRHHVIAWMPLPEPWRGE